MKNEFEMVFVYGSLKMGFPNHRVLQRANGRFVGTHVTDPNFTMVSLHAFPGVVLGGETPITGEVYEVDTLDPLDSLEGYPSFYTRGLISTPYGHAWMYTLANRHSNIDQYPKILSGVWNFK